MPTIVRAVFLDSRGKDLLLAASSTSAPTAADIAARTASRRVNFAKIAEPMQAPNLLGLQTDSFDWLVGNSAWRARVDAANAVRPGSLQIGRAHV